MNRTSTAPIPWGGCFLGLLFPTFFTAIVVLPWAFEASSIEVTGIVFPIADLVTLVVGIGGYL